MFIGIAELNKLQYTTYHMAPCSTIINFGNNNVFILSWRHVNLIYDNKINELSVIMCVFFLITSPIYS